MGFRWIVAKLHLYGLLPSFVAEMMNLKVAPRDQQKSASSVESEAKSTDKPDGGGSSDVVVALESEEQFDDLIKKNEKFVVKFTASWCQPCKKIHPFYQQKCTEYTDNNFVTVDVDDFDTIASKYNIAMMPTFIVIQGSSIVGTYSGSSQPELDVFLQTYLR